MPQRSTNNNDYSYNNFYVHIHVFTPCTVYSIFLYYINQFKQNNMCIFNSSIPLIMTLYTLSITHVCVYPLHQLCVYPLQTTSLQISKRLAEAEQTETLISTAREKYRTVATRGMCTCRVYVLMATRHVYMYH